jgi:hypothetical protein
MYEDSRMKHTKHCLKRGSGNTVEGEHTYENFIVQLPCTINYKIEKQNQKPVCSLLTMASIPAPETTLFK